MGGRIREVNQSDQAMAARYGTVAPRRRRLGIAVSGLVGLVALVWLAWAVWFQSTPQVQSALRSFDVVDEHTVDAVVEVRTRDEQVRASCLVRAYGTDHSVVGELNFRVSGVDGRLRREVSLRTERPATSVQVVGCTTPDQSRPR